MSGSTWWDFFHLNFFLLVNYGVTTEKLKRPTTKNDRNRIAKRIGNEWKNLATSIGVSDETIDDICKQNPKIKHQHDWAAMAMMVRWEKQSGTYATCLQIVQGLWQIDRKDLIDVILIEEKRVFHHWYFLNRALLFILSFVSAISVIYLTYIDQTSELRTYENHTTPHPVNVTFYNHSSLCTDQTKKANYSISYDVQFNFNAGNKICNNTALSDGNLPIVHQEIFVGRDIDVKVILNKMAKANIVNINGAPGFGKSALAKHIGHMILRKYGTLVQYINVEDKFSLFYDEFTLRFSDHEVKSEFFQEGKKDGNNHYLVDLNSSLPAIPITSFAVKHRQHKFINELKKWSEEINCFTLLILDNCDNFLESSIQDKFSELVKLLVRKSHFNLHIIITSRIRLLYIDWFDSWTVKELDMSASVDVLSKKAPGINVDSLYKIARVLGGCPLALKVIGQLLHIRGDALTYRLYDELMALLNTATDKNERLPAILDVAFSKLGVFKECGYSLGFFSGSFDKNAANAIITKQQEKDCIQMYVSHSLMDEYYIPHQQRYEMNRLIKEYLKAKSHASDKQRFKQKFKDHFIRLVLTNAMKLDLDSTEMLLLSSEVHNLQHLRTIMVSDEFIFSQELATLAFLVSALNLVKPKELHPYYPLYMMKINDVCRLLNSQMCGQLYNQIVQHFYHQCKCETYTAYVKHFFTPSCMEHIQCEAVDSYFEFLNAAKIDQLSQDVNEFLIRIQYFQCRSRKFIILDIGTIFYGTFFIVFTILSKNRIPKYSIIFILLFLITTLYPFRTGSCRYIYFYQFDFVNQPLLWIEILVKTTCQVSIFLIIVFSLIITALTLLRTLSALIFYFVPVKIDSALIPFTLITYSMICTFIVVSTIYVINYISAYCCQFVPICL